MTGSDRSFGLVMTGAFAILAALNWWRDGRLWPGTGAVAGVFLAAALLCPVALNPLNRAWQRFGRVLHKVVNPIVMSLLFYTAVLPTGVVMRALGKDPLRRKRRPDAASYWITRQPAGPAPETMKDQF